MRRFVTVALVFSLIATTNGVAVLGATATSPAASDYRTFGKKLSGDDQVRHALERLTFGPRPGELETVRRMGVRKWIDQQLHPERIAEDPELARRLEPLESLRISQAEAARNYPNPQLIRAIAMGRAPMPDDPVTRVAVERMLSRLRSRKGASANAGGEAGNDAGIADAVNAENSRARVEADLSSLLTRDQIRTLRMGTLEEKKAILSSITEDRMEDIAIAMPPGMRVQLLVAATPELRRKLMLLNAPQQLIAFDLSEGKLYRAILSNRQLAEQLDDFWFNHFNVFLDKGSDRFMVPTYEREAIRPNVLGRFRDLLEATATSPAMLFYLDNWQSAAPDTRPRGRGKQAPRGLNENYARELMELHTLGVDGGYTQKDVTEVARCFTGWTIRAPREGGGFFFNERIHDKGQKVVLGVTIPAGGGKEDGERVLDILAKHASTARFISTKLAQRFVADDPPPRLIEKMAKTFRESNGDIRAVMRTMLTSNEFFSEGAYRAKVKTPLEMVVSAVRTTGASVDFAFPLANRLNQLGQPLYRKLEPTGYSNLGNEWVNSSALLARMNFALDLVQNRVPGVKLDAAPMASGDLSAIARQVLLRDPSEETRAAIEKAMAANANGTETASNAMATGLLLGSPEFQRR